MADTELMSLGELSDGAVRPWYLRDDDRRTRLVYGAGAVVVALFGLIFSFLLGSVDGGIKTRRKRFLKRTTTILMRIQASALSFTR